MSDSSDFSGLITRIKKFCDDRDWSQFHDPKNLAVALQLEASEVLELFLWTKDNQLKSGKDGEIKNELSDVFYWTIMLANHYNIDLLAALHSKMDSNELKYPVEKSKGNSKKYTEF